MKKREIIDLKNEADSAIHNTEKSLNEHRSKLGQPDIEEIEREIQALRELGSNSDAEPQEYRD